MTRPDDLTEAQERLLLSLPACVPTSSKPGQKLLALGLAIYTGDDRSNMALTQAGRQRLSRIASESVT